MSVLGFLIFFVQSTAFAYFFVNFLGSKRKWFDGLIIVLVFNLIMEMIALWINNSYINIPTTMILTYILLRILFKKQSRKRCILAVFLYEGCMIVCEMISLIFILLAGIDPVPAISTYQYALGFYVLHYVLMILFFTIIIHYFGPKESLNDSFMIWETALLGMQIITCVVSTSFYYDMNIFFLFFYTILFFVVTIFLFKKTIEFQRKKKQEITIQFLKEHLQMQCQKYIELRNQEQFRKLRHDYINFIEQQK